MGAPAVAAGAEMRKRLDTLLAERRASGIDSKDDDIGRLLRLQSAGDATNLDDDSVCRTLMGLFIGMVETTSRAAARCATRSHHDLIHRGQGLAGAGNEWIGEIEGRLEELGALSSDTTASAQPN